MPSAIRVIDDHGELTNRGVKTSHDQYHTPLGRLLNFTPIGYTYTYYGDGVIRVPSTTNSMQFSINSLFLFPFLTLRNITVGYVRFGVVTASFFDVSLRIGFYTATDDWQPITQVFALTELTGDSVIGPGLGWTSGTYSIQIPVTTLPTGRYVWAANTAGTEVATSSFFAQQSDCSQILGAIAGSTTAYRTINRLRKNSSPYGPLPVSGATIQYDTVGTATTTTTGYTLPFGFGDVYEAS